ncbi:MAG: hypothetical protein F4X98_10995 [Gammaproteobacteria bacterium]|nr:hypothetical protein [Gammaproteobacteria bacterium]
MQTGCIGRILDDIAREFGPRNTLNNVGRVIRRSLKPLEEDIRNTTPVDEGSLRASTRLAVSRMKRDFTIVGLVGRRFSKRSGAIRQQGLAVEFGNERTDAQPTILPAFKRRCRSILDDVGDDLRAEMPKAVRRFTRRRGAGKLKV